MKIIRRSRRRATRRGMQTFEWIIVLSILGVGIIGGVAAVRNTIIDEFSEAATAIGEVDICPCLEVSTPCP